MSNNKPAYLIASSSMPAGGGVSMDPYVKAVWPLLNEAGAQVVAAGKVKHVFEQMDGTWPDEAAMTIIKFPSSEVLLKFWNSPGYQAIKHLRTDITESNFVVGVEGF